MSAVPSATLKSWAGFRQFFEVFGYLPNSKLWSEIFGFVRVVPGWLACPLFDGGSSTSSMARAPVSWLRIQTYVFTCVLRIAYLWTDALCLLNVIRLRLIQNIHTPFEHMKYTQYTLPFNIWWCLKFVFSWVIVTILVVVMKIHQILFFKYLKICI